MNNRVSLDHLTDDDLDQLYDDLARTKAALADALDCIILGNGQPRDPGDLTRWRAALNQPGPPATHAIERDCLFARDGGRPCLASDHCATCDHTTKEQPGA